MKIESITVKNYKVFKNITINDIPKMCVFLGTNGSGKTTLFDVFGFLHDSLLHNVKQALARRGGFKEVRSRDSKGPIEFEIKFRENINEPLVTYELQIDLEDGNPIISKEILKYRRGQIGKPWYFLDFSYGKGIAITNEEDYGKEEVQPEREEQKLDSPDILAIKGLGQFQKFKQVSTLRKLIESWRVSDFHISAARSTPEAGYSEHLSSRGDNLALVAQYMYENHKVIFKEMLKKMKERVPGISDVKAAQTEDGRVILKFQDGSFKDPFISKFVSDGAIKIFAYLILLYDPQPHPLLCIEEPENQLYPHLLIELSEEFRLYSKKGGQVFISTHSPDFVNGVFLDELFLLVKQDGFTQVKRVKENENIKSLYNEGDKLGYLWKQDIFEGLI